MRCLNAPPVLNSLESQIVESCPVDATHVLVVNAGDGRLARALRQKTGERAVISVVGVHQGLFRYLDDFPSRHEEPWNLERYGAQVALYGPFDCIVFYQLHEFWNGGLHRFVQLCRLAKSEALIWVGFLNAQSNRLVARYIPPVRLGFSTLADPLRYAGIDYGSMVNFISKLGGMITELWGMLDENGKEFCQKAPKEAVQWDVRGSKVTINGFADAFLWSASCVGLAFVMSGRGESARRPKISYSPYTSSLLQALVLPYPDSQSHELTLAAAELESETWRDGPGNSIGPVARFFLTQIGETAEPKRVLLLGCGWGRDLEQLNRHRPSWEWVGWDHDDALVRLARERLRVPASTAVSSELGTALPFADGSFDLAVSLGYCSGIYEPAARWLTKEVRRVTRGAIYHLEDHRGPDHGLHLKALSLHALYSELGEETTVQPVLLDGSPIGMYMLKVAAPA